MPTPRDKAAPLPASAVLPAGGPAGLCEGQGVVLELPGHTIRVAVTAALVRVGRQCTLKCAPAAVTATDPHFKDRL